MMCEECGKRPAIIHLTTFVNGDRRERNLCTACMSDYKKHLPDIDMGNFSDILSGLFDKAFPKLGQPTAEAENTTVCAACGTTYAEFRKTGMLGCAECYEAFAEPIAAMLNRTQGTTQHTGRVPGGTDSCLSLQIQIDKLRQALVKAIADEAYEQAATLRDQIRALTAQLAERTEGKESEHDGDE